MISKELLSEVLGYEALPTQVSTKELQYIDKRRKHGAFHPCRINIYELSHKCKEWALSQKCFINLVYNEFWWYKIEKKYIADIPNKNKSFYEDTEVEAIIKACEWILNNKSGGSE